jgi:uncharacterized RDD family membrane protein YckC
VEYEERTRIATPEGVELELVLAGLASRFIAEIVDAVLIVLAVLALIAVAAIAGGTAGLVIVSVAAGGLMLISVVFHVAFEVLAAGRTPGKRANGLRVVMDGGEPVGLRASAIRNLLRLLEGPPLFYVPAIVAILATRRNQRLGDLAAGTLVVREPRAPRGRRRRATTPAELAALSPALRLSEWDVSAITQEELAAVRTFLARRDGFAPAARRGLARDMAARLGAKVAGQPPDLPAETLLEGIAAAKSARS